MHADVSREGAIDAAVAAAGTFGGLDCLFNNAGNPGSTGGIEEMGLATFDRTVAVHLRGSSSASGPQPGIMRPPGHGSIINTASVTGLAANYGGHDYSACKAAILQLTRTTANELGEDGVRVNAICPGAIATPIFGRAAGLEGEQAQRTVDFMTAAISELAPIRRAGQPLDIAEAALWLASNASSYVNGQAIAVDGGLLTGPLRASNGLLWKDCWKRSGSQPSKPRILRLELKKFIGRPPGIAAGLRHRSRRRSASAAERATAAACAIRAAACYYVRENLTVRPAEPAGR